MDCNNKYNPLQIIKFLLSRLTFLIDGKFYGPSTDSGHSYLMGKRSNDWQAMDEVLALFGEKIGVARRRYHAFLMKGIAFGTQPDLVGGRLIRCAGGRSAVRLMREAGQFQKSDERMLGDGEFVKIALSTASTVVNTGEKIARDQCLSVKDILNANK